MKLLTHKGTLYVSYPDLQARGYNIRDLHGLESYKSPKHIFKTMHYSEKKKEAIRDEYVSLRDILTRKEAANRLAIKYKLRRQLILLLTLGKENTIEGRRRNSNKVSKVQTKLSTHGNRRD